MMPKNALGLICAMEDRCCFKNIDYVRNAARTEQTMMMMIFRLCLQQGQIQKYELHYCFTLTKEDLTAAEDRPEKYGFYFCSFFFVCALNASPMV